MLLNAYQKPILVTGSHRSGTTWIGKIISTSDEIAYIHEPLNLNHSLARYGKKIDKWFTYICDDNENYYISYFQDLIGLKINFGEALSASKLDIIIWKSLIYRLYFLKASFNKQRPLIKDPISLFSAEWLASRFSIDILVLIRHPAAFVSSVKIKNWSFPFSHFLEQDLLMRDYLNPFRDQISEYSRERKDIVDQAILLWNIFHSVILLHKERHKNWLFYRHEDISLDPDSAFQHIFDSLNLDLSDKVKMEIKASSNSSNSCETTSNIHITKRNSKLNILSWKNRLSKTEIEKIKYETHELWKYFYSENDW